MDIEGAVTEGIPHETSNSARGKPGQKPNYEPQNEQDVEALMSSLRMDERGCALYGESEGAEEEGRGDHILVMPEGEKIKLRMSIVSQSRSMISLYVYLSRRAAGRLADYLNDEGFTRAFDR